MIDCKHIPPEMKAARRWVLWRQEARLGSDKPSKLPYYANGKERGKGGKLDDEKDLAQLVVLDEVLAVLEHPAGKHYEGIGFALGPDGTGNSWQGIDLDHIREKGLTKLAGELPSYVEKSPSGDGVHAIGYGNGFAALGSNVSGIEAYSEKRYFTVTGKVLIGDELCDLSGFVTQRLAPLHKEKPPTCFTQRHRVVEVTDTQDSHDTQDSQERKGEAHRAPKKLREVSLADLPENCRPTSHGQRHRVLFDLARHLKTLYPDAEAKDAVAIVKAWHSEFLPVIATKAWSETWGDFADAWSRVKFLVGEGVLDALLADLDQTEAPPACLEERGYDEQMWAMVRLLKALAERSSDGTFYMGNRTLARLFGVSPPTAGKLLRLMASDQIIELLKIGRLAKNDGGKGMQASTYRFIGQRGTGDLSNCLASSKPTMGATADRPIRAAMAKGEATLRSA